MRKKTENQIREKMVQKLELPKDLVFQAAIVTITGRKEVLIENYKGILNLDETAVFIQTTNGRLSVKGAGLSVEYFTNEEMKISGRIDSVQYEY